jgi:ketosteroid isomerase-like protein
MKTASFLFAVLLTVAMPPLAGASPRSAEETANLATVERAFAEWKAGTGSVFDLLTPDAIWTILGPTASAGTYTRDALVREVLTPFNAALATPLRPEVRRMLADGSTVVVLFEAGATLRSGRSYRNSYAWFLELHDGRVVEVTAVLDLHAYDAAAGQRTAGD